MSLEGQHLKKGALAWSDGFTRTSRHSRDASRASAMGHRPALRLTEASGRCRFGQGTVVGTQGNGQGAPEAAISATSIEQAGRPLADIRTGVVHQLIRWISNRNGRYQTSYRNPPMGKIVFARRAWGCFAIFPSPLPQASLRRSDDFPRRRCGMGWRRSSGHWLSCYARPGQGTG